MAAKPPTNARIAEVLDRIADLLEAKHENEFRVNSYRHAALIVRETDQSIARLAQEKGKDGLRSVPGIGEKLSSVIEEFVTSGSLSLLDDLEKEVPGVPRKQPPPAPKPSPSNPHQPSVEDILDVDAEYLRRGKAGTLKMIAPKQNNPEGKAWLPILSARRGEWKFTALFSNTARAHELGKTDDWVVVYFKSTGGEEQCTVITSNRGPLNGKRVVRGREQECEDYYREMEPKRVESLKRRTHATK